ncbi:MAG: transposase [Candidatus Zixiibacteriota bacterium]
MIVTYIYLMPKLRHYDHLNTARFVTFSCYRRLPLLTSEPVIQTLVCELGAVRARHLFRLLGYVIMPEHVHLVIHPRPESKLGLVIAEFKSRSAAKIIAGRELVLREVCRTVREGQARYAFWQPRCYDHNCRTPATVIEKINYCHHNPVKRGLVAEPGDWRWSSYGWYYGREDVPITIDEFEGFVSSASGKPT